MKKNVEKISLIILLAAIGFSLAIPLATDANFFFAFIFTKVLYFRVTVMVMVLFYLLLVYVNREYLPKVNIVFGVFAAFVLSAFISSLFGLDLYLSFWSDMERGEGLILYIQLLIYFLILISVLKEKKRWVQFFNFSIIIAWLLSFLALGQYLNLENILKTTSDRVDATFGNPAYLGTYLIFHVAFALYLFAEKKSYLLRGYYALSAFMFAFIIFQTKTRGSALGLFLGLLAGCLFYVLSGQVSKKAKAISFSFLGVAILASIILSTNRDSEWIKNYPALQRVASISLQERTAQTRLATWKVAWNAMLERPFFGYGLDNFYIIFDKNFPKIIYDEEGSQIWFDRAHNIIFDKGVTTGFIGLILYLLFLILPVFVFFKSRKKRENFIQPRGKMYEKFFSNAELQSNGMSSSLFIGLIVAFIIQDLFIFETVGTFIVIIFTWAFFSKFFRQYQLKNVSQKIFLGLAVMWAILIIPIMYYVNIKPSQANALVATAHKLGLDLSEENFFEVVDLFQKALDSNTYGVPEYRIRFIEYIDQMLSNKGEILAKVAPILRYTDQVVDELTSRESNDTKSFLLAMRHFNATSPSLPKERFERLDKAMSFFPKLVELSPNRAHIYYEAGFTNLYRYRNYKEMGETVKAKEAAEEAEKYFLKAIELYPDVDEPYVNLLILYIDTEENEKILALESELEDIDFFEKRTELQRLIQIATNYKNYRMIIYFTEKFIELEPENLRAMTQTALSYAYLGEDEKAIEWAEKIQSFGDATYTEEAKNFILEVRAGKFRDDNQER